MATRSRKFLSTNATFFAALVASPTLRRCADQAAAATAASVGTNRSAATAFEDEFVGLVLQTRTTSRIVAETIAACPLALDSVTLERGPAGSPADLVVRYQEDGRRTVAIATNVKRLLPHSRGTEGCSLPAFLRLALDPAYDPAAPPHNRRFDFEEAILDWVAGRRQIQDGRDYYLLIAYVDGSACSGLDAWSVMGGVKAGMPVAVRHETRAVLRVNRPDGVLPDDLDVNAELSRSMLPRGSVSATRASLVALLAGSVEPLDAAAAAAGLLAMTDDELTAALAALATSGSPHPSPAPAA
jgi:hypothetical protein